MMWDDYGFSDVDWGAYDYGGGANEYIPLGDPYDSTWDPYISSNGLDYVPPTYNSAGYPTDGSSIYSPSMYNPSPLAGRQTTDYAPGTGQYSIGGQVYDISAPGGGGSGVPNYYQPGSGGGIVQNGGFYPAYAPTAYTPGAGNTPANYRPQQQAPQMQPSGQRPQQASGKTQMPQLNLGGPGGPVWDRLQSVMADPTKMTQDPAFTFLYNQGLQALNRSLAAQRLTHSGKALTDTLNYGQGAAANYFNQLIPQLRGVAGDEYQRWAGPAQMNLQAYGLGQRDTANQMQATGMNNRLLADERGEQMLSDILPLLQGGSQGGMMPSGGGGIGWGGASQSYNPASRTLQQDWQPSQWEEPSINTGPVEQYYQPQDIAELYL